MAERGLPQDSAVMVLEYESSYNYPEKFGDFVVSGPRNTEKPPFRYIVTTQRKIKRQSLMRRNYKMTNENTSTYRVAVYPGSFDPVTMGHMDIITRASKQFDLLIVAVLNNLSKNPLFTIEERKDLLKQETAHLPNVEIDSFRDLLANYIRQKNAQVIVRGSAR